MPLTTFGAISLNLCTSSRVDGSVLVHRAIYLNVCVFANNSVRIVVLHAHVHNVFQ